jgi:hypothetical protein
VRRVHSAPVARKHAPTAVHRQVKTAPVDYRWRGARKDPSGSHAGTTKDPFSPKYRTLVRQDQSLEGLLANTNASMLAARMIEQWKAQQRARIIAELQQRIAAQRQAAQQPAQPEPAPAPAPAESQAPAEPAPSSSPDPAPAESTPAEPAPSADPAPAETGSQDSDGGSSADTSAE